MEKRSIMFEVWSNLSVGGEDEDQEKLGGSRVVRGMLSR